MARTLDDLKLSIAALTDRVYVGYVDKKGEQFTSKVDVTNMFLHAVVTRWCGFSETLTCGEDRYEIAVKKINGKSLEEKGQDNGL